MKSAALNSALFFLAALVVGSLFVPASIVLAATSTSQVSMDLVNRGFYAARLIVVETTDGGHSASATATY